MVERYTPRGSLDTTFQACREHLPRASTTSDGQQTVQRFPPCVFGLYPMVVLLYWQLPQPFNMLSPVCWRGKSTVTFAAMLICVRRALWEQWGFHTQTHSQECSTLSPSLQDPSLAALVPAA